MPEANSPENGQMKSRAEAVDTNVVLRFLVKDNLPQYKKAEKWFQEAKDGKRKLVIKPLVVAESCFVLESFYKKSRKDIASSFEVFLSQKWLKVDDREVLLSLWYYYNQNMHFVDSYLLSWAKLNKESVLSFDEKLSKKL